MDREKLFPQKLHPTDVGTVTGNTIGPPVSRLVVGVCSAPPTAPICVRTETENTVKLQNVLADLHIKQCEHRLTLPAIESATH